MREKQYAKSFMDTQGAFDPTTYAAIQNKEDCEYAEVWEHPLNLPSSSAEAKLLKPAPREGYYHLS